MEEQEIWEDEEQKERRKWPIFRSSL